MLRQTAFAIQSLAFALALTGIAGAQELLFNNTSHTTSFGASESYKAGTITDTEIADDFETTGVVTRLYVQASSCAACVAPGLLGAHIRFYTWTQNGPGALLSDEFLPSSDPRFHVGEYGTLDLRLAKPFAPGGKAFVGVQLEFVQNVNPFDAWYWNYDWSTLAWGSPTLWGITAYERGNASGQVWKAGLSYAGGHVPAQMRFTVYGVTGAPPDLGSDACGTWAGIPLPDPANSHHTIMRSVDVLSEVDAWAVGETYTSPGGETKPVAMHFDGTQWSIVQTPVPAPFAGGANCGLDAVKIIATNDVWAGGWQYKQDAAGYVGPHLFVIHWDGSQWSTMNTPMPPTLGLQGGAGEIVHGIDALGPNDIWFVGDWLEPLQSTRPALAMHWNGSSFTIYTVPLLNTKGDTLNAVTMIAPNDVWAVGSYRFAGGSHIPYQLHWDGSTWSLVSIAAPGILNRLIDVVAIASNDIWACGETFVNNNYKTWFVHYDGSQWSEVASPGGGAGLYARASNDVYSVGGNVVHWDGSSWTTVVSVFGDALGVSLADVAGDGLCGIFAVGREDVAGDLMTYGIRVLSNLWADQGGGVGGATGVPVLSGQGAPYGGQSVIVSLTKAPPLTLTTLILGSSAFPQPLFGGMLFPVPQIVVAGLPTNAAGNLTLWATWPAGVPSGLDLYLQYWMPDPTAPFGVAGSNALYLLTP